MSHTNLFTLDSVGRTVPASADEVIAAARQHIARRFRRGASLTSPEAMRDFLRLNLGTREFETFCCLFLDNRHRLIEFVELFRGTLDGASVHPREVVREALQRNAAAVIFVHPHPLCCVAGVTLGHQRWLSRGKYHFEDQAALTTPDLPAARGHRG